MLKKQMLFFAKHNSLYMSVYSTVPTMAMVAEVESLKRLKRWKNEKMKMMRMSRQQKHFYLIFVFHCSRQLIRSFPFSFRFVSNFRQSRQTNGKEGFVVHCFIWKSISDVFLLLVWNNETVSANTIGINMGQ